MQEVVAMELEFADRQILATEFVLDLDQLVLKLDSLLPLRVELGLQLFLSFLEFGSFPLEDLLQLADIVLLCTALLEIYVARCLLRVGVNPPGLETLLWPSPPANRVSFRKLFMNVGFNFSYNYNGCPSNGSELAAGVPITANRTC